MTIRAGSFLLSGGSIAVDRVLDRVQSGGPTLNVPTTTVYQLGADETVAVIRDIADLTFNVTSLDVSTEMEAMICNVNPDTVADGHEFDYFTDSVAWDIISPFRALRGGSAIKFGLLAPYLSIQEATYRFGVSASAEQTVALRGDSLYVTGGSPYYQVFAGAGVGPYLFTHGAIPTFEGGANVYAYSINVINTDGTFGRLVHGDDYTDNASGFTLTAAPAAGAVLHVVYASTVPASYGPGVLESVAVKPAAVRGKDIDVYISDGTATPTLIRWRGLQTAEIQWKATAEPNYALGFQHATDFEYGATAQLTGTLGMRPQDVTYLYDRIAQITGTGAGFTANALSSVPLEMQVRINHPDTGATLKTFIVDDARFDLPNFAGQANQRLEVPFKWTSDSGTLKIVKGVPL